MTWTNGNDVWNSPTAWTTNQATGIDPVGLTNVTCAAGAVSNITATCAGGTGGFPSVLDAAWFTNSANPVVKVTSSMYVDSIAFLSNTVVTINAGSSTLTVTDSFRVAQANYTTATVYWAAGTLAVTNNGPGVIQIGTGTNSVGALYVTNGTVLFDRNTAGSTSSRGFLLGAGSSAGKLVISGPGVVTNILGGNTTITLNGGSAAPCELIVTNGGKLFTQGSTLVLSNGIVLVSDPGSVISNSDAAAGTGSVSIGAAAGLGRSLLIVSNGATVFGSGSISIGRTSATLNTGIVVGAGSKLISGPIGGFVVGSSVGSSNNDLTVYDGGYINCGGPFFSISDSASCINNSLHMGGVGAMSSGTVVAVRNNSGSQFNTIIVTNAILTCSQMQQLGLGNNILSVLSKGTLVFTNQFLSSAIQPLTNVLTFSAPSSTFTINAGTVSVVSGSNAIGVVVGNGTLSSGDSMAITNGGKLLTELGTIGTSSSYDTGIVSGVGSIWSNYTAGAAYVNSNSLSVGGGTTGNGINNYLAIQDGATLVNNGSLNIGNSGSTTSNSVVFGGPGNPAVIIDSGMINVGGASGTSGNTLTVSNASVTCDTLNVGGPGTNRLNDSLAFTGGTISANYVRVRLSNTFAFAAGTLSTGGMDTDPGANNSNVFVVGNGTSAAYYDMAAGGTGYHNFDNGGLVITNGASLRGSGTLTGTMNVLGTFVPGFSGTVGAVITSNSLSFGSSAVLDYDLGISSDSVTVNGNLKLGGTLNIANAGGFGPANYTLFTYFGSLSAGTLTVGTTPNGSLTYTINTNTAGSVVLQVTGVSDPYTTWTTSYGLSGANAAGTADPDHDGVSNTNEFLAGFNPTSAAAYPHIISIAKSSGNMSVTYLGANGDSTYSGGPVSRTNVLEFTTGAANGSYSNNFATTGQTNILSGGTGVGLVTNMIDPGGAVGVTRYYRIRVIAP